MTTDHTRRIVRFPPAPDVPANVCKRPIADVRLLVDRRVMASNRHVDPFRLSWSARLLEVARSWKLFALGMFLIAALAAVALVATRAPERVEAQLIRFGSRATDEGDKPLLLVRLADGTVRQVLARRSDVRLCRVGQTIQLMKRGSSLTLQPGGCLER